MSGAYVVSGGEAKYIEGFGGEAGIHTIRWEDNIKMGLKEPGWWDVERSRSAYDRSKWWVLVTP
jgi:hypothetical protein